MTPFPTDWGIPNVESIILTSQGNCGSFGSHIYTVEEYRAERRHVAMMQALKAIYDRLEPPK